MDIYRTLSTAPSHRRWLPVYIHLYKCDVLGSAVRLLVPPCRPAWPRRKDRLSTVHVQSPFCYSPVSPGSALLPSCLSRLCSALACLPAPAFLKPDVTERHTESDRPAVQLAARSARLELDRAASNPAGRLEIGLAAAERVSRRAVYRGESLRSAGPGQGVCAARLRNWDGPEPGGHQTGPRSQCGLSPVICYW